MGRGVWGCAYYELVLKKKIVTDLYRYTASHKTPTNDHFRRNSDCMWLMTFIAGFPIHVSNIYGVCLCVCARVCVYVCMWCVCCMAVV